MLMSMLILVLLNMRIRLVYIRVINGGVGQIEIFRDGFINAIRELVIQMQHKMI